MASESSRTRSTDLTAPMLDAAEKMYVLVEDGWRESRGVTYEIGYMQGLGKQVFAVDYGGTVGDLRL